MAGLGKSDGNVQSSPRSFLIQYLTLMLIVLSFMVGSFVTKMVAQKASPTAEIPAPELLPPLQAREVFTIQDTFELGSAAVETDKLLAMKSLFSSHDLMAEVQVFADPGQLPAAALSQAMARSLSIRRALEGPEIPSDAIRVFGRLESGGTKVQITLLTGRRSAP